MSGGSVSLKAEKGEGFGSCLNRIQILLEWKVEQCCYVSNPAAREESDFAFLKVSWHSLSRSHSHCNPSGTAGCHPTALSEKLRYIQIQLQQAQSQVTPMSFHLPLN